MVEDDSQIFAIFPGRPDAGMNNAPDEAGMSDAPDEAGMMLEWRQMLSRES